MKSLCWRPKDAILFWKIPAPIHPAKDTTQTTTTSIASRDPFIYTHAVEFYIFAVIATTDNFLSLFGKLKRVKKNCKIL